ncbi:hypothetical protein PM082_001065 [Marasmius tenuissimus]|nr:hypothetical protein PM082_001065 [Marasmius tenuissimus]
MCPNLSRKIGSREYIRLVGQAQTALVAMSAACTELVEIGDSHPSCMRGCSRTALIFPVVHVLFTVTLTNGVRRPRNWLHTGCMGHRCIRYAGIVILHRLHKPTPSYSIMLNIDLSAVQGLDNECADSEGV